jgi:hypothetical protein
LNNQKDGNKLKFVVLFGREVFMIRLREEYDEARAENAMQVSSYPTEKLQYEVFCDMCGEIFFIDGITFEKVSHALREGFDNPFVCDKCRGEIDELAYSEK